ncbi:MAG: hypothetical protein GX640_07840 [Fibrobacter sp.]|nr:hypothetical protein [Fibrobacter sp.]
MSSKHCRLYDENLVHNIMISTGLSILEYLREHTNADSDEICEFIELNAGSIIEDTIEQLSVSEEKADREIENSDEEELF